MKRAGPKAKAEPTPIKTENKTLVVYATKGGATFEAADLIAKTLREKCGFEVDVVNLRKQANPDITKYTNIVVGGGVRAGKVYKETAEFMKQDLSGKQVAIFICSGAAGDPRHHDEVAQKYITKGLASTPGLKLVSMEAFGGCIRILGKAVTDRRDPAKIQAWAEELCKKFSE